MSDTVARSSSDGEMFALVGELADDFARRRSLGEPVDVEEYVGRHPDLAGPLRAALRLVGVLAVPDPPVPLRLGEYAIVREVGRGGMGVVYEAVQESLGRRVALKVLPGPGRHAERFRRETQALARLHHTNIVPVFAVGEAGGLHYYAMQLIDGRGLDQVIAGDPLAAREVARVGLQAAEALAYAHAQGVLHRDVKPSNLLLDSRGDAWLSDFGLARVEGLPELTESNAVLGTLRYLPPECLSGTADARADVYSLGLTLYELWAGRPAFGEADRVKLVHQITAWTPPPPGKLRPGLPRDLETIVLMAIAKEPVRRYASAQAMADDLRAFLDDRPIAARRLHLWERAWRWARRNPVVGGLTAALAVSLVAGAAAFAWQWRVAVGQRRQAEAHFAKARDAVNQCFDLVTADPALQGPGMEEARKVLLRAALPYYEEFLAEHGGEGALGLGLREELARTHARVGRIYQQLGSTMDAVAAYERAAGLYAELAEADPDGDHRAHLGDCRHEAGVVLHAVGDAAGAERAYLQAEEVRRPLAEAHPGTAHQQRLAETYLRLATLHSRYNRPLDADPAFARAAELAEALARADPDDFGFQLTLANVLMGRGEWHRRIRRKDQAEADLREAIRRLEALHARRPDDLPCREGLAVACNSMAGYLIENSSPGGMRLIVENFRKSLALREGLAREHPRVLTYQVQLGTVHANLGLCHYLFWNANRAVRPRAPADEMVAFLKESEASYQQALAIRRRVAREHPNGARYRASLAKTLGDLGRTFDALGRHEKAADLYREALSLLRPGGQLPDDLDAAVDLGSFHRSLGMVYALRGDAEGALRAYAESVAVLDAVLAREPRSTVGTNFLRDTLQSRADLYGRLGRQVESLADWCRVLALPEADGVVKPHLAVMAEMARAGMHRCATASPLLTKLPWKDAPDCDTAVRCAQVYAAAHAAALADGALPSTERAELAEEYARRAVELVTQAVGTGGLRWSPEVAEDLRSHPDFAGLRGREEFRQLLAELR